MTIRIPWTAKFGSLQCERLTSSRPCSHACSFNCNLSLKFHQTHVNPTWKCLPLVSSDRVWKRVARSRKKKKERKIRMLVYWFFKDSSFKECLGFITMSQQMWLLCHYHFRIEVRRWVQLQTRDNIVSRKGLGSNCKRRFATIMQGIFSILIQTTNSPNNVGVNATALG